MSKTVGWGFSSAALLLLLCCFVTKTPAQIGCNSTISALAATPQVTVATLPVCNAGLSGTIYLVTNALSPVVGIVVAGGGAISTLVHCNGTAFVVG